MNLCKFSFNGTGNGKPNRTQTERPVPGRGRQGKGGLRATGSPFGESGARNLRVKWDVDRMSGPLVNSLIDWTRGDVARRLKITARGARLRKSPVTAGTAETTNPRKEAEVENEGSGRPRPEAENGGSGTQRAATSQDQGFGPGPGLKTRSSDLEDGPAIKDSSEIVPAKILSETPPCAGFLFLRHNKPSCPPPSPTNVLLACPRTLTYASDFIF